MTVAVARSEHRPPAVPRRQRADLDRLAFAEVGHQRLDLVADQLLALEQQGGDKLFGEPALDLGDLLRTDLSGRGQITILHADRLFRSPRLYAAVLLWILSELFEHLPEVGDPEKPRLALFLDEAHLLFADAPQELQDKIEQVVRLIRSKGVGVYLVTQNPLDVPEAVLGQLGNRVQHALRAFTPRDQKAVRSAAETFRPNPAVDVERAITELAVGEALVSLLDAKGTPEPVERGLVLPPRSRLAPLSPEERARAAQMLGYAENSVGRLMTPHYIAVKEGSVSVSLEQVFLVEESSAGYLTSLDLGSLHRA